MRLRDPFADPAPASSGLDPFTHRVQGPVLNAIGGLGVGPGTHWAKVQMPMSGLDEQRIRAVVSRHLPPGLALSGIQLIPTSSGWTHVGVKLERMMRAELPEGRELDEASCGFIKRGGKAEPEGRFFSSIEIQKIQIEAKREALQDLLDKCKR